MDEYLRPLAAQLPSHVRDTTDFLTRLRKLGHLLAGCLLATPDVSSPYINIDTDVGLEVIEQELNKTRQNKPSPKTLTAILEKVLKMNNFTFRDENILQVKGTAVGTRVAPNFANVYMGHFEEIYVYNTEWSRYLTDWIRFIDDIFLV